MPPPSSRGGTLHPAAAPEPASTPALLAAFAALYVIWGSTYLAIRFAIESLPPFSMAGVRFLVAGAILYVWTRYHRGIPAPTVREWRATAVVGALLLLVGNGAVVWAEQWVPSGLVALLIGTVPLWMVLLDWAVGGPRPDLGLAFGLLWGLAGVGLLVGAPGVDPADPLQLLGVVVVLVGCLSWAAGSIYSRTGALPAAPRLATAMQMLVGGGLLLLAGVVAGEPAAFDPGRVTLRSILALGYLIVAGSLVAFSAYIWLLRRTTAARVSTYAYVNPVVALFLGWALADEPFTARTAMAAVVILTAVMLITARGGRGRFRAMSPGSTRRDAGRPGGGGEPG